MTDFRLCELGFGIANPPFGQWLHGSGASRPGSVRQEFKLIGGGLRPEARRHGRPALCVRHAVSRLRGLMARIRIG